MTEKLHELLTPIKLCQLPELAANHGQKSHLQNKSFLLQGDIPRSYFDQIYLGVSFPRVGFAAHFMKWYLDGSHIGANRNSNGCTRGNEECT